MVTISAQNFIGGEKMGTVTVKGKGMYDLVEVEK